MRQLIASITRRIVSLSGTLDGYEQPALVDTVFQKTLAYEPKGDWPEMRSASSVLDFGGGCGQHHKLARLHNPNIRWAVVETPAMVARASELASDRLQFFISINAARNWLGSIDVMHSNGALQYTPNPEETLTELCSVGATEMHWARVALTGGSKKQDSQLSLIEENGPGARHHFRGKAVRYSRTFIPELSFLAAHSNYKLAARGPDWFRFVIPRLFS